MKRLVKKSEQYIPFVGDLVIFKSHPYDNSAYTVTGILPDGTIFIENDNGAYSGINTKSVSLLQRKKDL